MFKRWMQIDGQNSCLILGARRAGKTTLVKNLLPDWSYATLDDLDYLDWTKKDPKGFIKGFGNRAVIDEIQRVPRLTIAGIFRIFFTSKNSQKTP